jgi:hypothetical protein
MSGYFSSCSLHLLHSCSKRLLLVVYFNIFVYIFHRSRACCSIPGSSLIRSHTTRWPVNITTTVSTPKSWPLCFDVNYIRSMRAAPWEVKCIYAALGGTVSHTSTKPKPVTNFSFCWSLYSQCILYFTGRSYSRPMIIFGGNEWFPHY